MLQNKLCVRLSLGAVLPANICFGKYFGIKIYFVYLNFKVNKYKIFSDLAVLWGFISPFQLAWLSIMQINKTYYFMTVLCHTIIFDTKIN